MKAANLIFFVLLVCSVSVSGQSRIQNSKTKKICIKFYSSILLLLVLERILERSRNRINQQIINLIENQRENFPLGWPRLGIPPIDPLYIEEFETSIEAISTLSS